MIDKEFVMNCLGKKGESRVCNNSIGTVNALYVTNMGGCGVQVIQIMKNICWR